MSEVPLGTFQKALRLNVDATVYGTFAEIGAGQEVARWFFQVGHAAGTVAKTMSAYDMAISDAIYGKSDRYVSRQRLEAMLTHEYALLVERLTAKRGATNKFFVFADTTATRRHGSKEDGHSWLGVRFQAEPGDAPSEILIHAVTRDPERIREQEAIGIVGVNLIYAATFLRDDPRRLLRSLRDNVFPERIEIDMIKCAGPAFATVDNRLMALWLVREGLTEAAMFTPEGEVVQPAEILYRRPILVHRGRFNPATRATVDLLDRTLVQFSAEPELNGEKPVVVAEMTVKDLGAADGVEVDEADFLARVDVLRTLGYMVLISNLGRYFRLVEHLLRYTQRPIGFALGVSALHAILKDEHYKDLAGAMLEAVGRLFAQNVRIYLYPMRDPSSGAILTADTISIAPPLKHLFAHLTEHRNVVSLASYDETCLSIDSDEVLRQIRSGDVAWERCVPAEAVEAIKRGRLFGWKQS